MSSEPTENTSLVSGDHDCDDDDANFPGQELFSNMKKTTHNDPSLRPVVGDMHELYGSTRMLMNVMEAHSQEKHSASVRRASALHSSTQNKSESSASRAYYTQQRDTAVLFLEKIKTNFFEDATSLAEGTIPQSVVVALVVGIVCGVACWLYYTVLFFMLELLWHTLPEKYIVGNWSEEHYWLWIPLVCFILFILVGLSVVFLGEPGDLPYTISRVHHDAYIPMNHVVPMIVASLFSIIAGGSLGPEAPLVAICGALGGFVSRRLFRQKYVNVVRKHTLMGMSGALAAFFGAPLGGSLFALEVNSRFGVEYFEHLVESIFCGEICLVVFRYLSGLPIKPIWDLTAQGGRMMEAEPWQVLVGGVIGLLSAFMAYIFALFHSANMKFFASLNLLDNRYAVYRALLGGFFVVLLGLLIPQTMFWGEDEFQIVANMLPASELPNIWPTTGLTGWEMDTPWKAFVTGMAKLVAISFTVAGGLRGGYIFPLMCSGAAFGRVLNHFFEDVIPLQVSVLCFACGLNVAITRTSLASTLILAFLPGEPCAIPAILMAALCSLFATAYLPFIKSQITRSDIDHSLFHEEHFIKDDAIFEEDDD